MKIIQNVIEHIKAFLLKYAKNSLHTLSSDIKEFFATYILGVGYYIIYILPQRDNLKRTKELKNTKKGKNCFVFANGPSLNLLDARKIERYQKAGFDIICVNSYILSDMADIVVPNYYVLSDPASFNECTQPLSKEIVDAQRRQIDRLNELNIPVFIPAQFSKLNIIKQFFIFNDVENRFSRNIDPLKPRGYLSMTGYKALAIACYLGYGTIYICGFDNDYFKTITVDENNDLYYIDKHYYDNGIKSKTGPNAGKGLGNYLWVNHLLFKGLELFNHHNIINLNKNSLVDAFSKSHNLDVFVDQEKKL
jgi:hypothetical protein